MLKIIEDAELFGLLVGASPDVELGGGPPLGAGIPNGRGDCLRQQSLIDRAQLWRSGRLELARGRSRGPAEVATAVAATRHDRAAAGDVARGRLVDRLEVGGLFGADNTDRHRSNRCENREGVPR